MKDYKELAKDLRRCKTDNEDCFICDHTNMGFGRTHCRDVLHTHAATAIEELTAEVERLTRERDAAVNLLRGKCWACKSAKPFKIGSSTLRSCDRLTEKGVIAANGQYGCEHWEFIGVQEGGAS